MAWLMRSLSPRRSSLVSSRPVADLLSSWVLADSRWPRAGDEPAGNNKHRANREECEIPGRFVAVLADVVNPEEVVIH
jgi:hypothetical protein